MPIKTGYLYYTDENDCYKYSLNTCMRTRINGKEYEEMLSKLELYPKISDSTLDDMLLEPYSYINSEFCKIKGLHSKVNNGTITINNQEYTVYTLNYALFGIEDDVEKMQIFGDESLYFHKHISIYKDGRKVYLPASCYGNIRILAYKDKNGNLYNIDLSLY